MPHRDHDSEHGPFYGSTLVMDATTSVDKLKALVKRFCEERDWDQFHGPKDLAIGLVTEASELLELFRFKTENEIQHLINSSEKRKLIEEELADTFYFLIRFSQRYKIDLTQSLIDKMEKNALRYPVEKSKGNNKKYNEF